MWRWSTNKIIHVHSGDSFFFLNVDIFEKWSIRGQKEEPNDPLIKCFCTRMIQKKCPLGGIIFSSKMFKCGQSNDLNCRPIHYTKPLKNPRRRRKDGTQRSHGPSPSTGKKKTNKTSSCLWCIKFEDLLISRIHFITVTVYHETLW